MADEPPRRDAPPSGEGKAIVEDAKASGEPKTSLDGLRKVDYRGDIDLKRTYAKWLLVLMTGQIVVADVGFFLYGFLGVEWEIEPSVMHVWLVATLVEVIGVVFGIARYLFPRRDVQP